MSNVTRFGPSPLLDNEIANKAYVDSGSGGVVRWCQFQGQNDTQFTASREAGFSDSGFFTNPNPCVSAAALACTMILWMLDLDVNTRDGDVTTVFEVDRTPVGTAIVIPASTTGTFTQVESESLSVGTEINIECTIVAGSSGLAHLQSLGAVFEA